MRVRKSKGDLTVRAIAGSYVVVLAIDYPEAACDGLLGFAIKRTRQGQKEGFWIKGSKRFESVKEELSEEEKNLPKGDQEDRKYPSDKHPLQDFVWSDFNAEPGESYTYLIRALGGSPKKLETLAEISVKVTTESEADGDHDIYFNRGAAASQQYVRRFKGVPLDKDEPEGDNWKWLSRGAMEAIKGFVDKAKNSGWGLRVAAYEFKLPIFAKALRAAHERGADVQICYDANHNRPDEKTGEVVPRDGNLLTAKNARIKKLCIERITRSDVKDPPIAHNKFIVLLKKGKPQAVLLGSTNFSWGGVFGQSNVVHVVEDPEVAAAYLAYWNLLSKNRPPAELKEALDTLNALPKGKPAKGTRAIFSPQGSLKALEWYAKLASENEQAIFMTFAFGMNKAFQEVYRSGNAKLRFALMETLIPSGTKKEKRPAAIQNMRDLQYQKENLFAVGSSVTTNEFDSWVKEQLTGLNVNVLYIHTKFMLIDPLGNDPIVITGSANFSDASTTGNDENMIVIRGNKRVADVYLGEYLRLWKHYAFRGWLESQKGKKAPDPSFLDEKNTWWKKHFEAPEWIRRRQYFSGSPMT